MRRHRSTRRTTTLLAGLLGVGLIFAGAQPAAAANYVPITGQGSTWAGAALDQWRSDVSSQNVTIRYSANGSSLGRSNFAQGIDADFAVSEIPYDGDTADPQDTARPDFHYNMLPLVSGGTSFMYNLPTGNNTQEDCLKLSQEAIAGIFTGTITRWDDPIIAADNADCPLPAQRITVVVRSEGSGATAQFTLWLMRQFPALYQQLCATTGCDPTHGTSYYPHDNLSNFVAQNGSTGVTQYTANTAYTISYDEYAYPLNIPFPVASVKNAAGFYTVPDKYAVAVAMTYASINTDPGSPNYLSQDLSNVYEAPDPRTYPLSMYTYQLAPTELHDQFTPDKGASLGFFDQYLLCEGQQTMGDLGYSPLPMNLVLAALDQVKMIPGVDQATLDKIAQTGQAVAEGSGNPCNNPTFRPGDSPSSNLLVQTAPFPPGCDAACSGPFAGATGANEGPVVDGPAAGQGPADAGTGGGGGANVPAAGDAPPGGAVVPKSTSCDPDTGVCSDDPSLAGASNVKAIPAVIAGQQGWAGPQTLMVILGLLILVCLFVPAVLGRVVRGPGSSRGGRP